MVRIASGRLHAPATRGSPRSIPSAWTGTHKRLTGFPSTEAELGWAHRSCQLHADPGAGHNGFREGDGSGLFSALRAGLRGRRPAAAALSTIFLHATTRSVGPMMRSSIVGRRTIRAQGIGELGHRVAREDDCFVARGVV